MSRDVYPGDVDIKRCVIRSLDGGREFNFIAQVAHIDIYESVMQPLITGDIVLRDGIGLLRSFPIIGEEQVEIEFATPDLGTRKYILNVERVGEVEIDATNKSLLYTLSVVSPEQFNNATTIVSQRYKGEISSSIDDILSNKLLTTKDVEIGATTGIDDILITNITPLQAIDKLRHRAVSPSFSSSSFAFYEDVNGFHFKTLEQMLSKAGEPVADLFYDDNLVTDVKQSQFRDMLDFYQPQTQATTEKLRNGAVGSIVKKFDMITGSVEDVVYNEQEHVGTFEKTGKYARDNTAKFLQSKQSPAFKMIMPWTPGKDPEEIADKKGLLHSFVAKIMQNIAHMNIYGDSDLNLGDCVQCTFVNGHGLTGNDKNTVTNRFVVAKIRHSILNSNRPTYMQAIEGINNSYDS